ncbi:MAG: hypothetical protein H8D97_00145, partial [Proteobacteria bacterium]|nr:hypothetical protein [Pseudomonadota bacterium]
EHFTIGFCGKIIPIFKTIKNNSYPYSNETKEVFFYGDDALEELYNFLGKNSKLKNNWRMRRELEKIKANKALKLEKIFIDFNVPIFLIGGNRNYINKQGYKEYSTGLTLNPCLKNYKFFTQYDAYQAFQEISMFIGGVLPRKEPDTVDISDACRSYQKGFDSWSFRKSGPNSKKKAKTTKGDKCQ